MTRSMRPAETFQVALDGRMVRRGFWLYVWEATTPDGEVLLYVGRTGDNSTVNAQSPFNRMGQHLGFAKNSNMLRKYLEKREIVPEEFRLVARGPILPAADDWENVQRHARAGAPRIAPNYSSPARTTRAVSGRRRTDRPSSSSGVTSVRPRKRLGKRL